MSKNPNKMSRKDNAQIQKAVYCEQHDALRVIHANDIETSFSLNHKEDSVVAKTACRILKPGKEHDCSDLQKVQAYSDGVLALSNGVDGHLALSIPIKCGEIIEICGMTINCDVWLVGR